jgi:hypothetical protein
MQLCNKIKHTEDNFNRTNKEHFHADKINSIYWQKKFINKLLGVKLKTHILLPKYNSHFDTRFPETVQDVTEEMDLLFGPVVAHHHR